MKTETILATARRRMAAVMGLLRRVAPLMRVELVEVHEQWLLPSAVKVVELAGGAHGLCYHPGRVVHVTSDLQLRELVLAAFGGSFPRQVSVVTTGPGKVGLA